ncbi:hypothetical protein ACLQ2D_23215 [Streptomyces sp. DT199]|uniref:hypothetical protein n=1 Tax=Streptomyces sp. DT199 TaxID=3393421 RepID=UPI003CEFAD21
MAIADELGYFADHEVPAASLLLWSEGITGVPQPPERLEEPALVRRMCRIGSDLQLTRLLQALVTAALAAGTEPGEGAAGIAEILRVACGLAEPGRAGVTSADPGRAGVTSADPGRAGITPADVHRMWRVAHLPAILRPASDAPHWGKAGYRAYDAELERLLQGERSGVSGLVFDLRHPRGILLGSIGVARAPYGRLSELLGRVLMLRASRRGDRKRVPQYSSP